MMLREALQILGPKRVALGLRAILDRREGAGACASCFVGEAFGGTQQAYLAYGVFGLPSYREKSPPELVRAAQLCEAYFEGDNEYMRRALRGLSELLRGTLRETLRDECIAFLAENGTAKEPQAVANWTEMSLAKG